MTKKFTEEKLFNFNAAIHYTGLNRRQLAQAEKTGFIKPEVRSGGKYITLDELSDLRRNRGKFQ